MKPHAEYMEDIEAHIAADNYIRGKGWIPEEGKGCAVGCTFGYYDHARSARETNTPEWLWCLEDTLYEGMSLDKSKTWPREVFSRINFDTDAEVWRRKVLAPFMVVVLESVLGEFNHKDYTDVKKVVDASIELWERDDIGSDAFNKAAARASRAASRATAAAAAAAEATAAAAAEATAAAAEAATEAARAAARAAGWEAAWAAEAAAAWAGEIPRYDHLANEFLRILDEANLDEGATV